MKLFIYLVASMLLGPVFGSLIKLDSLPDKGNLVNAIVIIGSVAAIVILAGYFISRLHSNDIKREPGLVDNLRYRDPISDATVTSVCCLASSVGCALSLPWIDTKSAWFVLLTVGLGCLLGVAATKSIRRMAQK